MRPGSRLADRREPPPEQERRRFPFGRSALSRKIRNLQRWDRNCPASAPTGPRYSRPCGPSPAHSPPTAQVRRSAPPRRRSSLISFSFFSPIAWCSGGSDADRLFDVVLAVHLFNELAKQLVGMSPLHLACRCGISVFGNEFFRQDPEFLDLLDASQTLIELLDFAGDKLNNLAVL